MLVNRKPNKSTRLAKNSKIFKAIIQAIQEKEVKEKCEELPYMHEGKQVLQWVIIDYINVVVHIMLPDSRRFYKLEEMWSDANVEEHEGLSLIHISEPTRPY